MAIHHPTPPLCGGERPRLPSAHVGPVTQAIRAMREAEPVEFRTVRDLQAKSANVADFPRFGEKHPQGIRALSRTEIEDLIGGLIDLLDAMDGDTDHEADFVDRRKGRDGAFHTFGCTSDDEPSLCGLMVQSPGGLGDDREHDEAEGLGSIPDWSGRGVHEVFVGWRV